MEKEWQKINEINCVAIRQTVGMVLLDKWQEKIWKETKVLSAKKGGGRTETKSSQVAWEK